MRKTLLTVPTLTLLFLFSGRVCAQQDFITASLTAQVAACPTNPGNSSSSTSAVTLSTLNAGGATFTIGSSAFSGTVAFFASGDGGTTWVGLNVFPSSSTTPVTGATAAGLWQANVSAYTHVCMAATTFSSGTITVTIRKSTVSARAGGGGGGGGVTSVATTAPISGGTITTTGTISCPTCVTSAAALTSTALVTGAGLQAEQTPSATSTLSAAGNLNIAGSLSTAGASATFGTGGGISMTEGTAATAAAGSDICYGDSTAHSAKCSYNNGSFFLLPLLGGTTAIGNTPVLWNWTITTDAQDGLALGETAAATNGTLTNGLANQAILSTSTATNSTATPLEVAQGSITNTVATPAMQIETTWNNAGLAGRGILLGVTNTASAGGAQLLTLNAGAAGATLEFNVDKIGNVTASGAVNAVGPFESTANSTAVVYQGGQDAGTGGALGAVTLRGADNSQATTGSTGGATTVRGGDATGGTNNPTGGALTIRGGNVVSTGTPIPGAVSITGGGLTGAATNVAGADVSIAGGLGTGNATPSHVKIQGPGFVSASGTGAQAQVTRLVSHAKAGSTTSATATNMFNVPVAASQTAGFEVLVHVETTQATPQNCSTTEEFWSAVQNTSATVTQQTTGSITQGATICSTGTLTLAAAFSTANPAVFSVTPTWTVIVPTAVIITIEIHNLSQQDITLL